jgi:hypothetical protein
MRQQVFFSFSIKQYFAHSRLLSGYGTTGRQGPPFLHPACFKFFSKRYLQTANRHLHKLIFLEFENTENRKLKKSLTLRNQKKFNC